MGSWIQRVWVCDVDRCNNNFTSPHLDDTSTPSSYNAPEGWWATRAFLKGEYIRRGAVYLCPKHATRGNTYLAALREYYKLRGEYFDKLLVENSIESINTCSQEVRYMVFILMNTTWDCVNPKPTVNLENT